MDRYTPPQILQYLTHISYPTPTALPPPTLETLRLLAAHHLAAVPFESLSLHYSPTRRLTIDPEALLAKVIGGHGAGGKRGGYCMEVNTVLACVLRGLGFDVVSLGGRISFATDRKEGEGYSGWSHMVNIITIDSTRYLLDLGFGPNPPQTPLPLPAHPQTTSTMANKKLTLKPLLSTTHPSSPPSWIYSHRASPSHPWIDAYALSREEFRAPDFEVMNLDTMTESLFTRMVICVRGFFGDEGWWVALNALDGKSVGGEGGRRRERGEVAGQLVLVKNTLKYRLLNTGAGEEPGTEWEKDVPLATFTTEDERIEALRTYFGVELSEEERAAILALPTAVGAEGEGDPREEESMSG